MTEELKQSWREHFKKYPPVSMTQRMYNYLNQAGCDLSNFTQVLQENGTVAWTKVI